MATGRAQDALNGVSHIVAEIVAEKDDVNQLGDPELTRRYQALHTQATETRDYLKTRIEKK
jgi:hypothetical protein